MKNPYKITDEIYAEYFLGWRNKVVRIYFYLREGLNLLNDFKYLVAGILALYVVLKIDNKMVMVVMFLVAVPILIMVGYYWVHKARKSLDWFGVVYTTHFSKYNIELIESQLKTLEEIRDTLKNKDKGV